MAPQSGHEADRGVSQQPSKVDLLNYESLCILDLNFTFQEILCLPGHFSVGGYGVPLSMNATKMSGNGKVRLADGGADQSENLG